MSKVNRDLLLARAAFVDQTRLALGEAYRVANEIGNTLMALGLNEVRLGLTKADDTYLRELATKLASVAGGNVGVTIPVAQLFEEIQVIFDTPAGLTLAIDRVSEDDQALLREYLSTTVELAQEYVRLSSK